MRINPAAIVAAVGACLAAIGVSMAVESNVHWRVDLNQGSSVIAYGIGETEAAAKDDCRRLRAITRAMTAAETRKGAVAAVTTVANRWCKNPMEIATVRPDPVTPPPPPPPPPPPTCAAPPAPQTRQVPCGVGYTGTYSEVSSSTMGPPTECAVTTTWTVVPPGSSACVPQTQPPTSALFHDSFEYDVSRSATNADVLFGQRGWGGVKSINSAAGRGNGWVYTRVEAGSRVLVLESNPGSVPMQGMPYSQTDYYLQLGREGSTAQVLPANVWIQFATYATPTSRFSTRDKTIYPCSGHYACSWGPNLGWLFMWGSGGFNGSGDGSSRRFLAVEAANADNRGDSEYPTNKSKLRQNMSTTPLAGGVWYDVKLHFDTSGAQGSYEAWVRQRGQSAWTKVSDWRGGQTANFFWPIPADQRRGHTMFRWPTTVNGPGDSTVYVDDFKIAQTEASLN